ncbi:DUF998 domain-containing protein [Actinomadura sp. ATCC 31491]|uniref:DUF998 domain-containing protein n=1 Tax=Actinomadura luzonensis TaxID=2805427 RepID=A0ABT0GA42_9ACTN|nr:DUF998 domain-containing protein [Actinomadura luzonensis]MCK2221472.1 DUF998 domain-containing protein [Actinomadura luzonensis]
MTPRWSVAGTLAGTLASAAALAWAELTLPAQPLLSDYALVPGGMMPVLAGMLALAGACLCLAYGLATAEPARTAATRVLLLAGAAGLMMSAVFPTDPGTAQVGTLSGEIHRWSAAVVFTSLPVAGWSLARGRAAAARWNAVRAVSVASALTLAVYLAAHPAAVTSPLIGGASYYGLLERAVVLAEMTLLVTMALAATARRVTGRAAAPVPVEAVPPRDSSRLAA